MRNGIGCQYKVTSLWSVILALVMVFFPYYSLPKKVNRVYKPSTAFFDVVRLLGCAHASAVHYLNYLIDLPLCHSRGFVGLFLYPALINLCPTLLRYQLEFLLNNSKRPLY